VKQQSDSKYSDYSNITSKTLSTHIGLFFSTPFSLNNQKSVWRFVTAFMQLEFMAMYQTTEQVRYRGIDMDFGNCWFVVTARTVPSLACEF
jgi:hypothetical protein